MGVNKYTLSNGEGGEVDVRRIDNTQVLEQQCAKLKTLRSTRDNAAVNTALTNLKNAARSKDRQGYNLLELAVVAARARATVGEITAALEQVCVCFLSFSLSFSLSLSLSLSLSISLSRTLVLSLSLSIYIYIYIYIYIHICVCVDGWAGGCWEGTMMDVMGCC